MLGVLAIVLGIMFKGQNVAYMVGLAFAIAASANFPALVLSMFWRKFTTRAAQMSMLVGTASSLMLIYLSPTIQIDVLKNATAWFPLRNPGLVSIPLSFAVGMVVALLWPEPEADARFTEVEQRIHAVVERRAKTGTIDHAAFTRHYSFFALRFSFRNSSALLLRV